MMHKNTDLHLKTRTVTLKKRFGELPQVLCPVQKILRGHRNWLFWWGIFGFSKRGHWAGGPLPNCFVLWGFSNSFPYFEHLCCHFLVDCCLPSRCFCFRHCCLPPPLHICQPPHRCRNVHHQHRKLPVLNNNGRCENVWLRARHRAMHCKGNGHQFWRVGLLGCFSLDKEIRERKGWDLCARDLQKPFEEFKTINSILLTKHCTNHTEISTKDIVTLPHDKEFGH